MRRLWTECARWVAVVCVPGAAVMMQEGKDSNVLKVSRIEIVDSSGKTRAVLGCDDATQDTSLVIYDDKGQHAILLGLIHEAKSESGSRQWAAICELNHDDADDDGAVSRLMAAKGQATSVNIYERDDIGYTVESMATSDQAYAEISVEGDEESEEARVDSLRIGGRRSALTITRGEPGKPRRSVSWQ